MTCKFHNLKYCAGNRESIHKPWITGSYLGHRQAFEDTPTCHLFLPYFFRILFQGIRMVGLCPHYGGRLTSPSEEWMVLGTRRPCLQNLVTEAQHWKAQETPINLVE